MVYRILLILLFWFNTSNAQLMCNGWRFAGGAPTLPTTNLRSSHFGDVGVTQSSNNVSSWADQSGNSRNWTQGTGGNQPDWDGSAGITFNGSSDYLQMSYTNTQESNIYIVVEFKSNTATQLFFGQLETIYAGRGTGDVFAIGADVFGGGGNFATTATAPNENQKYLISITANNASSSVQINNNTASTGSLAYSGNFGTTMYLGATFTSGSPYAYGNVKIYAIVIYGAQSSGDKASTKSYLNNKYTIY